MSNLQGNLAALTQVLEMLNDPKRVKEGEALIKPFLKSPRCLPDLVNVLQSGGSEVARHHASLFLKKKANLFKKLSPAEKAEFKKILLNLLANESSRGVSFALGAVVAKVFQLCIENRESWDDVFALMTQLASNPNPRQRCTNFELVMQIAEQAASSLLPHIDAFIQLLITGFDAPENEVKLAAFGAASTLVSSTQDSEEVLKFKAILTPVLNVLAQCASMNNDEAVVEGLVFFQEAAAMQQPLINDHLEMILPFCINLMKTPDLDSGIKQAATQTFTTLVENRPKLIGKKGLVAKCLTEFVQVIATSPSNIGSIFTLGASFNAEEEDEAGKDDDDSYDPENDVQRLCQICIDTMALKIPGKYFSEPALQLASTCITNPDVQVRKAGSAILGIIAEGCSDTIRPALANIVPHLVVACQDADVVREVGCFALGQFSEHCQPEILHYHSTVLPVMLGNLDSQKVAIILTSCYVLEMFCENLQPETLRPYLNMLLVKLMTLLSHKSTAVQESALSALAALSIAAEKDFVPYVMNTVNALFPLFKITDSKKFCVRGRALECLGHIAIAVGSDHFAPFFEMGMQAAIESTNLGDDDLKEYSYIFIANCAKAMKKAFVPLLESLVPHLLEVIMQSELSRQGEGEEEEEAEAEGAGEDDDDESNALFLNVADAFVNNKKAALTALGALAEFTLEGFFPYLEKSVNCVMMTEDSPVNSHHEIIRSESYSIIVHFVRVVKATTGQGSSELAKEQLLDVTNPNFQNILVLVISSYLDCIETDMDKKVVASAVEGLTTIAREIGLAALTLNDSNGRSLGEKLMQAVRLLLAEGTESQKQVESGEGEDEDEDHDKDLIDVVSDLVGALAKATGVRFVPYFDEFSKLLMKFMKVKRSHSDRAMALGCFAEVLLEIGTESKRYLEPVLPHIQKGLEDEMEGVRRNSAYCVAAIVQSLGPELPHEHILQLLQWLYPLCSRGSTVQGVDIGGADIDNAISAVARMISLVRPAIPLHQVLPVVLAALPLRADPLEGPVIYQCLVDLVNSRESNAMASLQRIVQILGHTISSSSKDNDDSKALVTAALKSWIAQPDISAIVRSTLEQFGDAAIATAMA